MLAGGGGAPHNEGVTDHLIQRTWPTIDDVVGSVRRELFAGDEDMAFRLLVDGVNRLRDAHAAGALDQAIKEPAVWTGSERWDALLAATVRYRLHQMGLKAPAWTMRDPLKVFWWPFRPNPSYEFAAMVNAPAEHARLGIFVDERALGTV